MYSLTSILSSSTTNATPHAFDKVIQILLRNFPKGACIPQGKTGRLPLILAIRAGERTWEDGIQSLLTANPGALHSAKLQKAYPEAIALVGGGGHPPARPRRGEKEGGLRIFQNLYLLSLHHRNTHGSCGDHGAGGRRGVARKPRKHSSHNSSSNGEPRRHRSLNSASHGGGGGSRKTQAKGGSKPIPLNPRTLTTVFQLLRSKPDLIDPETYRNLTD